jgi:hypothetical protein
MLKEYYYEAESDKSANINFIVFVRPSVCLHNNLIKRPLIWPKLSEWFSMIKGKKHLDFQAPGSIPKVKGQNRNF